MLGNTKGAIKNGQSR